MIAVIPAAGLGTRMATVTGGLAKELLPLGGQPVLRWVVEECLAAGADQVRIVGAEAKPSIKEFVETANHSGIVLALQAKPIGLADAVRSGTVAGSPALVPMADTVFFEGSPMRALAEAIRTDAYGAVAVHEVDWEHVSQYGIVGFDTSGLVNRVVEKPSPESAPSRWAIASRFALSAEAVDDLETMLAGGAKGLTLSELLQGGLEKGRIVETVKLGPEVVTFDCGDPEGYAEACRYLEAGP